MAASLRRRICAKTMRETTNRTLWDTPTYYNLQSAEPVVHIGIITSARKANISRIVLLVRHAPPESMMMIKQEDFSILLNVIHAPKASGVHRLVPSLRTHASSVKRENTTTTPEARKKLHAKSAQRERLGAPEEPLIRGSATSAPKEDTRHHLAAKSATTASQGATLLPRD